MTKKEIINLQINEEKFEEINKLIEEEAEKRANAKIKAKVKSTFTGLALVGTMAAASIGLFHSVDYAIAKESEINDAKNREYIEAWEDGQGTRWNTSNENSEDFEVEGNGYTGSYHSR